MPSPTLWPHSGRCRTSYRCRPLVSGTWARRNNPLGVRNDPRPLSTSSFGRDLVGRAEADATDVAGQAGRVFRNQPDGIGAIGLVDTHRGRRADAIAVQEQHDLADHLRLGPPGDDPLRTLGADAGHLTQAGELLLDALLGSRISETRETTRGSAELKFRIQFPPAKSHGNHRFLSGAS